MALKLKKWDTAEHLKTEEDVARYWEACLDEGADDAAFITTALGTIARARGMSNLARETGLTREGLYKALSPDGNPEFSTVMKVIRALGLHLQGSPAHSMVHRKVATSVGLARHAARAELASKFSKGQKVQYRQGRGTFDARVVEINEKRGVVFLERMSDKRKVVRPAAKVVRG